MMHFTRREVLKLGVAASAVAVSPKWAAASTERNVAMNRAAWASSSADFINTGHMSTDGQTNTKWQSADADLQWIYVDLGAVCNIRSVVLRWGAVHALAHSVQVSSRLLCWIPDHIASRLAPLRASPSPNWNNPKSMCSPPCHQHIPAGPTGTPSKGSLNRKVH